MGFFSNIFKRIIKAQTSMGDNMVRLGKETNHLDLTRDAAESAYRAADSVREIDNLTTAVENKISYATKVKTKHGYAVQFDYSKGVNEGATNADLDFLKPKQSQSYPTMPAISEDAYGHINVNQSAYLMRAESDAFKTQLQYFSTMYHQNGAIITEDGSVIKAMGENESKVTVEALSTGLKPLESLAQKTEEVANEVNRSTEQIIEEAKVQGAFAVHPKQTEDEIRKLAQKVAEISKEVEAELEALQVKEELKKEIFGWIHEATNKKNRYICAEINNAIIFISNQLDADKVMNPSIKNPSVIIAGLDDKGVPEKLVQFDTIADCRRELGSTGEKFTDMTMLRELSYASREFERIAQLTTSEHIEDVVYRLETAVREHSMDIKFDGANALVDKVISANNLREQAYDRIKSFVEERILGDSEFIKNNYPEKYEAFFKEVGAIYMGSRGDIANIDVMPIEHVVNFEEAKNGATPIKDMSFLLTVTNKSGEMASINYSSDMQVSRVALGRVEQDAHSINWSSANMQLAFDAKEGLMNGFENKMPFALKLPPLQNAISKYEKENAGREQEDYQKDEQGEER